jgi:hypothetical protein
MMTDTVAHTEVVEGYFIARVQRTGRLLYGVDSVRLAQTINPGDVWYIISTIDNPVHIYQQPELDLSAIDSSWLEYSLPLEDGACWTSDPHTGNLHDCNIRVNSSGFRYLSTGEITDCYDIQMSTFVGGGSSIFCPGIGIARREFSLNSTAIGSTTVPASYEEILIDYWIDP